MWKCYEEGSGAADETSNAGDSVSLIEMLPDSRESDGISCRPKFGCGAEDAWGVEQSFTRFCIDDFHDIAAPSAGGYSPIRGKG